MRRSKVKSTMTRQQQSSAPTPGKGRSTFASSFLPYRAGPQAARQGRKQQDGDCVYGKKCNLLPFIQLLILLAIVMAAVSFAIFKSGEEGTRNTQFINNLLVAQPSFEEESVANRTGTGNRFRNKKEQTQEEKNDSNYRINTPTRTSAKKYIIKTVDKHSFSITKNILDATNTAADTHPTNVVQKEEDKDNRRPCRVIIENKVDFHHEILESIALRYPLPWDKYNCSSTKPIMFDFALFDNRFPNGMITCPEKKCPKHLNETEFVGWKRYFEGYLQNKTFERAVDGRTVRYNKLIKYAEYESSPLGPPDAVIDATCDIYQRFLVWLTHGTYDNYCVLHRECEFCEDAHYNKSCFLTPMWPKSQCTFLPSDLPRFRKEDLLSHHKQDDGVDLDPHQTTVCLFGRERNHTQWANIFLQCPYEKYNVKFVIGSRVYSVKRIYARASGIPDKALSFVEHERDYVEFSKRVAQCDILLPATDPIDRPAHFPPSISGEKSKRKLTGSISQVVGYNLHSVMHHELERIYHDYFTAPVEVYGDSIQSKVDALTKMIVTVAQNKSTLLRSDK